MSETKRRGRRRTIIAAVFLISIGTAVTVVWAIACRRLDDGARDAAISAGWSLSADPARWRGWPIAAEIVLPNATLRTGPNIIPPLAWAAGTQTVRLDAVHPTYLTVSAAGPQTITLADARPVPFTANALVATIDLTQHDPVHLRATDLDIAFPAGPVHIEAAQLDTRPDSLTLRLSTLSLPGTDGQLIRPAIDALTLTARLSAPVVPMPTATESAQSWRAANGRLAIDDVALTWGPLAATGKATLTLDPALQPVLAGQITATGILAGLDRLVASGAIANSGAMAARGMLAILSAPTGAGPVTLPVTLQNGVVSLARIPLLRFAPIQWN